MQQSSQQAESKAPYRCQIAKILGLAKAEPLIEKLPRRLLAESIMGLSQKRPRKLPSAPQLALCTTRSDIDDRHNHPKLIFRIPNRGPTKPELCDINTRASRYPATRKRLIQLKKL